jgi:hypothetical protein
VAGASPSVVCLIEPFVSHSAIFDLIFYALYWSDHFPIITGPALEAVYSRVALALASDAADSTVNGMCRV